MKPAKRSKGVTQNMYWSGGLWEKILDSINDMVFIQDKDFRIIRANKKFAQVYGCEPEDLAGKKCHEVLHKSKKPWPECPFEKNKQDHEPHSEKIDDPEIGFPILVTTSPIFDDMGEFLGSIHIAKDISVLKKTEESLRKAKEELEAQTWGMKKTKDAIKMLYKEVEQKNQELQKLDKMKSEFTSTVSHELRTPLAITKEGISLVLDGITGELNEKQNKILRTAKDNIDRLARLINDLLDMAKIEAGRVQMRKEKMDLQSMVQDVVSSFEPKVNSKGLQLGASMPEDKIEVYADPDKVMQVFTNLIGNALKFTEKGRIDIVVSDKGDMAECAISDTGTGISKEDMLRVFDKFHQLDRAEGPGEKGTGLGLSIAKSIVELHGGRIWLESEMSKGTSFYFTLPAYKSPEAMCIRIIDEQIDLIRRSGEEESLSLVAVQILDMDKIISSLGREAFQALIASVRRTVSKCMARTGDMIAETHFGNIMVLLPQTDSAGAKVVCERISKCVAEFPPEHNGETEEVLLRFGIASFPHDGKEAHDLIRIAESSLALKKKILIVDDHPQIVRLLTYRINASNRFTCFQAFDGKEALEKVDEVLPDLIICDIMMPEMNGYEVIGHLKENPKTRDIPVIILTAYKVEDEKMKAVLPGSVPVIEKTEGFEGLMEMVDRLI